MRIIVAGAELVQARVRVVVATGELPGVAHRLALVQAVAIRVVVVTVLDSATAIHHFEHRAEIIGQVVVRAAGCSFTHQLPCTGSSVVCRGRASRSIHTQTQRTVDRADTIIPHTVGLIGSTVGVAIGRATGTDARRLVLVVDAEGASGSRELVAVAIVAVAGRGAIRQTTHELIGGVVAERCGDPVTGS